jgi:hypothetical protein
LKSRSTQKTLFAANYTDFREFEKRSVQISEIRGKGSRFISRVASWVNYSTRPD